MPVDILGNEIQVGNEVVFGMAQHMHLLRGVVVKIHNKTVTIVHRDEVEWDGSEKQSRRAFGGVVVVGDV